MDTTKLAAFVAAAEAGSLSRGAERLGTHLSTLSRQITDLESTLGATLLVRTGRGVRATPAGARFLASARAILRDLDLATADARGAPAPEASELRLSAPPDLAFQVLPRVLIELTRRHPGVSIEARSETRRVSILEEEYDAAIRIGPLEDSGLVARALGSGMRVVCMAPASAGAVRRPSDLDAVEHVRVSRAPAEVVGTFRGRRVRFRPEGSLRVGTFLEAAEIAASSHRVAILPSFTAVPYLASGRLVRVLPGLSFPRVTLHLVHTPQHRGSAVLRDLGDLVLAALAESEQAALARSA